MLNPYHLPHIDKADHKHHHLHHLTTAIPTEEILIAIQDMVNNSNTVSLTIRATTKDTTSIHLRHLHPTTPKVITLTLLPHLRTKDI